MADDAPASDNALLERLNALKPSTISLTSQSSSSQNFGPSSTIERAKPPSREDALTARLKSLREEGSSDSPAFGIQDRDRGDGEFAQFPPRPTGETVSFIGSNQQRSTMPTGEVDPLLHTDDETLEELLADLRSDDAWLDEMVGEEEEHRRVTALLNSLRETSGTEGHSADADDTRDNANDDDDNSEGELMASEINSVLEKTMEQVEWERNNPRRPPSLPQIATPQQDNRFGFPTVPSWLQDEPSIPPSQPTRATGNNDDDSFESSIASRMAALRLASNSPRGLPSPPSTAIDTLNLPQAPTSALSDSSDLLRGTDKGQKKMVRDWCVVCLEDGTVRCLGCDADDDVYCARCWTEMHIGPRAGYEERGHAWESFGPRARG
ncbi:hypothetical protein GGR50DRAFT_671981 [Xylaria sp. CBS 124048]|nr:hypothetical protein GGR50DRAFT_671981 [Xylaria sp. CBS 124048]